jgi:hypothetical protein
MLEPKHFTPFSIFDQNLIDSAPEILKSMKDEEQKHTEIAEKMIVHLDGMNLDDVDHVLLVLRGLCQKRSVVSNTERGV